LEPFDPDEPPRDQPTPSAVGRYCVIFRIEQQLVTTSVDIAPDVRGLNLGLDWLKNNVSTWNLDTGKVCTYDGSFQTRVEKDVQMLGATTRKKRPTQVLTALSQDPH